MPVSPWISCMWPGLARLWWRGDWSGLALAVAFTAGFNFLLLTTCLWVELVSPTFRSAGWMVILGVWLVSAWVSRRHLPGLISPLPSVAASPVDKPSLDLFPEAQSEYLQGNWYQAEQLLRRLIREDSRDVDSRMLLATLYRHTARIDESRRELRLLERIERSAKWNWEITQEHAELDRLAALAAEVEAETPATPTKNPTEAETDQPLQKEPANQAEASDVDATGN